MSYKKFSSKDLVRNVIVAEPEYTFTIHDGKVYLQKQHAEELTHRGTFTASEPGTKENKYLKHFNESQPGSISLHEMNVDRTVGSLVHSFVEKNSGRQAFKTISTTQYDAFKNEIGDDGTITMKRFEDKYPLTASLTRIFVTAGEETEVPSLANGDHSNRKYIRSLRMPLQSQTPLTSVNQYDSISTAAANMICIPGIFYGSSVVRGSVELNYFLSSDLLAQAKDKYEDGRIIQTKLNGTDTEKQIGIILYNQGLIVLTDAEELSTDGSHLDSYFSPAPTTKPKWLDFATGAKLISPGTLSPGAVTQSTYSLSFKGTNKIPTLTMYMYSEHGEHNYSHNPTFLENSRINDADYSSDAFYQKKATIKKINKSPYKDHQEKFENTTYISKIGIYDDNNNLIAIASLANPVKKTEKRDFMFKIGLDF